MPKIKTLKFEINKEPYSININCTSTGEFRANIPQVVCKALRLTPKLDSNTLDGIEKSINDAIKRYKESETTQSLHILIKYQSNGFYSYKKDGLPFITGHRNEFHLDMHRRHGGTPPTYICQLKNVKKILFLFGKDTWLKEVDEGHTILGLKEWLKALETLSNKELLSLLSTYKNTEVVNVRSIGLNNWVICPPYPIDNF